MSSVIVNKYIEIDSSEKQEGDQEYLSFYSMVCEEFKGRNDAYSVVAQINQLIKSVQKHRGYTMGLLSGDDSYREKFKSLQLAVKKRIEVIKLFSGDTRQLVSEKDKSNINYCWKTIANNWQEDNVSESLELHSHFVEQLLGMLSSISEDLSRPLLSNIESSAQFEPIEVYPNALLKVEVFNFVGRFLPENIERIGKLRALSTHLASDVKGSELELRKLRFLVDTSRSQISVLRGISKRIKEICGESYPAIQDVFQTEMQLGLLLSQVDNTILTDLDGTSEVLGRQIFAKATQVIDAYWNVVNRGFELMHQWHKDEFDFWLAAGIAKPNT